MQLGCVFVQKGNLCLAFCHGYAIEAYNELAVC